MLKRSIILIISSAVWLYDYIRLMCFFLFGKDFPATYVVIYYHGVQQKHRRKFAHQMDDLVKLTQPVPSDYQGPFAPAARYASITFDDGFTCVINNALPELVQRSIPVTIFIPTDFIGHEPGWIKDKRCNPYCDVVMSAQQLKELAKNPLAIIGSHGTSHQNFLLLTPEQIHHELSQSKKALEDILHHEIHLLSFPHGAFNQDIADRAINTGYKRLFSISPVLACSDRNESVTGRVQVEPTDWNIEFKLKLLGAYRWLPTLSSLKRYLRFIK